MGFETFCPVIATSLGFRYEERKVARCFFILNCSQKSNIVQLICNNLNAIDLILIRNTRLDQKYILPEKIRERCCELFKN